MIFAVLIAFLLGLSSCGHHKEKEIGASKVETRSDTTVIANVAPQYLYLRNTDLSEYEAAAFVVRCFDDRFRKTFDAVLEYQYLVHVDIFSVAGGAKIFASPEQDGDQDLALRDLGKTMKLHHAKRVMIFTHSDCGAYGGLARFNGDAQKEFIFHFNEHKKAKEVIQKRFPDVDVVSYFVDKDGVIKTSN